MRAQPHATYITRRKSNCASNGHLTSTVAHRPWRRQRNMALSHSALFLALVSTALAGPLLNDVTTNKCASSCDADATKFGYEAGKTYRYAYKSEVITHIEGAQTEKSKINVQAVVHVQVLSTCEMLLKLTDVELTDSHPERLTTKTNVERAWDFKRSLQQHDLRFAFKDGHVDAVCPAAEEETWVLNIKRAILSGLQNTMHELGTHTRNKESDVSGDCYVDYAVESLWSGYKITKVKDVNSCSGRAHYDPYLQTTKFTSTAKVQSLPLIRSTHQCEQTINSNKIIGEVTCQEKHVFRPFSTQNSGATTEVTFSLEHSETVSGSSTHHAKILDQKSLVFDYVPTADQQPTENRRGVSEVKTLMTTICTQTETKLDTAAPATYSQLVSKMRELTPEQLQNVHTQIKARPPCTRAGAFFHDALPSLGTPGSARLMRVLLTAGELTTMEANKWLTSMSFMTRPTRELLADVKELLVQNVSFRKATLAVTSLVNNYCHLYQNCGDHTEVRAIINVLDEALGYNCAFRNKQEYTKILTALKGIGNAGHAERTVPKLNRCLLNREIPLELRVAAVTAFRRMACTAERDELLNTFLSTQQDAELRLAAYLGLMACPTADILSRVQRRLETEEVNQVGSFVWTHLTNLQTTASPLKQDVRRILENQELRKTFDMDKRKFSRNIEWSTFSDTANAGVTVDSNLIWSPKSFLPRSANLNLTVDMFGESLNLVEVGGRAEGLENLLEKLFGPEKDVENHIPNMGRTRRSAPAKPTNMDPLHNRFGLERDTPKGSYYVRMFGNEIRFDDFQEFDMGDIFSKFDYSQVLQKLARQHNIDHITSGVLFDTSMIVPTVAGFPLRVRADGTTVVSMKAQGKVDLTKLFNSPPAIDIEGTVRPSAAVQVNAEMSVDASMARSGVRMVNTLRSNTVLSGKVEARTGGIFNLDINMPDDTIELFDATSKFFIDYRDTPREQAMLTTGRIERRMCSDSSFVKVSGLELCGRVSAPHAFKVTTAPHYPLTGPTTVSLLLNKRETYRGLHFETKFTKEQVTGITGTKDIAKISFSTPGSRIDREFTFEYILDNPEKTVTLNFKSPIKTVGLTGALVDTPERKMVKATGTVDSNTYDLTAQVDITANRFNTQYRPLVTVSVPNRPAYRMSGNVLYRPGKKAVLDVKMENVMEGPLELKGTVDYNKRTGIYSTAVEMESSIFDAKIEGTVERPSAQGSKSDISVEYTKAGGTKQTLQHKLEWKLASVSPKLEFELKTDLASSQWSAYNSDLDFSVSGDANQGQLSFVGGQTGTQKRVTLGTTYAKSFATTRKTGEAAFNFALPHMNWNHRSKGDFELGDQSIKAKFQKRCSGSVTNFKLHVARESVKPLKTIVEVSIEAPGRHHLIKDTVVESSPGTYDHNLNLDLSTNYKIRVDSTLKKLPRPEIEAQITIPEYDLLSIEGFVNPELTDFSSLAKIQYGSKVYSTGGTWRVTKSGANVNSDAKFELLYPERTVVATSKMSGTRRGTFSELEVMWDAKNDQTKRFMLKTDTAKNSGSPRVNLRTEWYPAQFIDVTISGKNDKKGWYHPERDLEAKFVLQSSFESASQVSASMSHSQTATLVTTQSEVSWASNKKISTTMTATKRNGWQDALIVVETTTPFDRFKSAKFQNDYSMRGSTYEVKNRLDWDGKFAEISVTASGDNSRCSYEGGVTLRSSYEGYNRMAMTAKHTDNGRIFNSQFQGVWRDGRTVSLASNVNFENVGFFVTTNGDISVSLPLERYKNNKLAWNHRNNANIVKSHIDLELDNEKSMFDIDSTLQKTPARVTYVLKSYIKTPYSPVENVEFDVNYRSVQDSSTGFTLSSSFKWAEGKKITFKETFDSRDTEFSKTTIDITTPFEGWQVWSFRQEWKRIGDKVEILRENKWGSTNDLKTTKLDGFFMLTFPETTAEFKLISSYPWLNGMFSMENKKANSIWESGMTLEYRDNKIELSSQVGWELKKKFKLDVKTTCPYIETFLIDMDHDGPANNFKSKIQVEHNMMASAIVARLESDVSNMEDMKVEFIFTSPFEPVSIIRSGFTHKVTAKRFNTAYTFELPGHKAGATNTLTWKGLDDIDEKFSMEYNTQKIETGFKFKLQPIVKFTTFLKTPFAGYRSTVFDIQYDSRVNTLLATEFTYGNNQRLALNIDYRDNANGRSAGRITIVTPFEGYESINLNFNHQGRWNNFKNSGTLVIDGRTFEAGSEFLYRKNKIKMGGNMKTPYDGYRTISMSFDHDGEPMEMKQEMEVIYGDNTIKITHEFRFRNKRLTHKLLVVTPFSALSSLRSEIKHAGPWKNFKNEGTLEYNGRVYSGNTEFIYGKKAVRGSISVSAPDSPYSVRFNHKGEMDDFTNNVQANFNGRSYSANTQFKKTARGVQVSTNVRTPHPQLRVMSATFNHRGPLTNFQNSFSLEINDNTYEAQAKLKVVGNDIAGGVEFKLPKVYSINVAHKGPLRRFENSVDVTIDTAKYEAESNFRYAAEAVSGSASLKIPEEYSVTFSHTGSRMNFANEISIKMGAKEATGNTKFVFANNDLSTSAGLTLPITGYESFSAEIKHKGDGSRFETEGTIELPFRKVKKLNFKIDHTADLPEFNTKAVIGYNRRTYGFGVSYAGNMNDFTTKGSIEYAAKKLETEIQWKQTGTYPRITHDASIRIVTPYKYLTSAETRFSHSIRDTSYRGQLMSLYNDEKYFDTEYTLSLDAKKTFTFTIKEPHSVTVSANYERTASTIEADANVNWDTTNSDSNVQVAFIAKSSPKYEFEIKVTRPNKIAMIRSDLGYTASSVDHGATIQWGQGVNKKVVYNIGGRKNSNGGNNLMSGEFELQSPLQNMAVNLRHECKPRSSKTFLEIGNLEKLTIAHDFIMREPQFQNFRSELLVNHPQLQRDIQLKIAGIIKPRVSNSYYLDGRVDLQFARDDIVFEGKLGDASTPEEAKYIAWCKLTYPRVGIDSQALVQGTSRAGIASGQIKLDHMAAVDGQWKKVHLITTVNKEDNTMNLEFKSPYNEDVYVNGAVVAGAEPGTYNVDMASRMGSRRVKAELALDKNAPLMDFKLDYKPEHQFHMYAKYLSSSTAQFEAYRRISGAKILDSQLAVRLNNSRLIHARAFFRPAIANEIKTCMGRDHGVQTFFQTLRTTIDNDVASTIGKVNVRLQPLRNFHQTICDHMHSKLSVVRRAYNDAYRTDKYYLKTSHEFVARNHAAISAFATEQYNKIKPVMDEYFDRVAANWEEAKARMAEQRRITHENFVNHASNTYNNMVSTFSNANERLEACLNAPWFAPMAERLTQYRTNMENWVKDTIDNVRTHPYVQPAVQWATTLPDHEYFVPLRNFHRDVKAHFVRVGGGIRASFNQMYNQATQDIDTEEMRRLQEWFQDRLSDGKRVYTYYGLQDAENYLRGLSASNLDEMKDRAVAALKKYIKPEKTRVTVWDPTLGDFQVEIYIPVKLSNIRDFPVDDARRLVTRLRNTMSRLTPDEDWVPWDTIYKYKMSSNPRDWVPPFKSHATIAGSQHYMTFDKTFYEFSGECSYVLAHDFIDKNFSVIVNYDTVDRRMTKKSITVLSNGKEIEIFPSFKVTVDRKQTELPVEFDDTSVIRQGNRIRLDNTNGVTVSCDLAYDRCTVNVTGWYFAKTAGMLGTYNNEQYDEMLTAEKRIVNSAQALADSWTVGSKCRAVNNARVSTPESESTIRPICAKYFQDQSSPFRLCYKQVDVAPFMTMCLNELSEKANQVVGEEDMCRVAAFYVDECNRQGVALRQPRTCVSCQLTDGTRFGEADDQKLRGNGVPTSADVVVVVSQKPCNARVIPKLQKMLDTLETALAAKGLRGNRYGVIGFGGDGSQSAPHSHTIEGQLFNRNLKVGKMIRELSIASDDSGKEAAIDALHMAARYPFRAGVSKTLVLLACETCSENLVSYPDMVELLLKRDIKMHLITPHDFRMKSNSPKANNIWGMTRHTVYTNKHANNLGGDPTLRSQTYMPKDLCAALSHESEGAIFNAKKFEDRKIKDFRAVVSSVVANVATPSDCQVCECMPDETGVGIPVCHSCNQRSSFYGLLPKFDEYIEANFLDVTPPRTQPRQNKNRSKNPRRRNRN